MYLLSLTSAIVELSSDEKVLDMFVEAVAATPGWGNVGLVVDDPAPDDAILEFAATGNRPTDMVIQRITPVNIHHRHVISSPVDGIAFKSKTNSLFVPSEEFLRQTASTKWDSRRATQQPLYDVAMDPAHSLNPGLYQLGLAQLSRDIEDWCGTPPPRRPHWPRSPWPWPLPWPGVDPRIVSRVPIFGPGYGVIDPVRPR